MKRRTRPWLLGLSLLAMLFSLVGCASEGERSQRPNGDWSRGVKLGTTAINSRVAMAADPTGETLYVAWVGETTSNGPEYLRLVRLDRSGRVVSQKDLAVVVERPTQVELTLDYEGVLHLTWIDRSQGVRSLFYTRLDTNEQPQFAPQAMSTQGLMVESYAVLPSRSGGIDIVWGVREGQGAGLYYVRVGRDGRVAAGNALLRPRGFDPSARHAPDGDLHLAWQEEPAYGERHIYYGVVDAKGSGLGSVGELATFPTPMGMVGHRPCLALTATEAYVFWSLERRGGSVSEPMAETYFTTFPPGRPELATQPQQVRISSLRDYPLAGLASPFGLQELARATEVARPATFIFLPSATQEVDGWIAVALSVQMSSRTKSIVQVVLTLWQGGEMVAYQVAGQTPSMSLKPGVWADAANNLHLAWIETAGFGAYDVFYTSSSESVRGHLNRITVRDAADVVGGVLLGLVQVVGFVPIIFVWVLFPLLLVSVYAFVRAEGDLARAGPRAVLFIAILLYVGFKYLFRPNWLTALPLPRFIGPDLGNVLIFVVPLLVSALAGLATWLYTRRREYASMFTGFGVFVGVDALLTLLIYVPGILAE